MGIENNVRFGNVSADYFTPENCDEYTNDTVQLCLKSSFKEDDQPSDEKEIPASMQPIVAASEFQEATLAFGTALESQDFQTAIQALHEMVITAYKADRNINQPPPRKTDTPKDSRLSCTATENYLEKEGNRVSEYFRAKREYVDTKFTQFIYSQIGTADITPAMHATIANAFTAVGDNVAAYDQYELAKQGATTKSSEILFRSLALQTLPPDEQAKHSKELTKFLRVELPALRHQNAGSESTGEVATAWLGTWNMLYANALKHSHENKLKLEEQFYENLTDRLAETNGNIPENELIQLAGAAGTILINATDHNGEIENTRIKEEEHGKESANTKHEFYISIVEKLRTPLIESGNKELLAHLDFRVKLDGLMAQHRYQEAMQETLPALLKEYSDTETSQMRLTELKENFPHLFKDDCLVLKKDFSDSDIGKTMAEREESLLRESTEIGFINSMLVGTGLGAGGCISGGATGAAIGAYFLGIGAAPGAVLGCKIGSVASGVIGTSLYVMNEQSSNVKTNAGMVEGAKRFGVSMVSEHEANLYKFLANVQIAGYGLLSGLPAAGLGKGAARLALGVVDRLTAKAGSTWLTKALALDVGKTLVKKGMIAKAESKALQYEQKAFESQYRGYLNGEFWSSLWKNNVKKSFSRTFQDLEAGELKWIGWVQNKFGNFAGKIAKNFYLYREPITWVPGSIYGTYDLIKNKGDLSLAGAIGLAMPANQLGRIAVNLRSSGSAVVLLFTIGAEYLQQLQSGYDLKAPDGWKIFKEVFTIMPIRALSVITIKGKPKYVNSLIEPPIQALKESAAKKNGKWAKFLTSIENDRNEGRLWNWVKNPTTGRKYKLHTPRGRVKEFMPLIIPAIATSGWQAWTQDADFFSVSLQTLARYAYGAALITPYIKAPRDMDTASAEFLGRAADSVVRILIFNEGYNKYTPSAKGYKVGISNYRSSEKYGEDYLEGKIKKGINTLEPFSGAVRVATGSSSALDYETWYRPDKKASKAYKANISEVLLGGPKENRGYDKKYLDVYNIYAENGDPTIGELAENWLFFLDYELTQYATHDDNPILIESFIAKSSELLLNFTDIYPIGEEQTRLQEIAIKIRERHELKIKSIISRFKLDHPDNI